jgi:diguanylate cyclase (GGDEF)-like protein
MMPEMDGFEFCRIIQAEEMWRDLHIIMTSARDTLEDKVKGLELGAADYLTKPFSMTELRARIQVGERIVRYRKALKEQQVLLEYMAREDTLTGLYNRRHFEERAYEECLRAHRYNHPLSLLFGDIDHFKKVNDRYGHACGDTVLKEVSQTLFQHCRNNDLIARYGGEEFTVLLLETQLEAAFQVAERLRTAVKALTFPHASGPFQVTMSFGAACMTSEQSQSLAELLEEADRALYLAKHKGRDRVECYTGSQHITPVPASGTGKA